MQTYRTVLLLSLFWLLVGCQATFFATLNRGGDAPSTTLRYGDDARQVLDVYRPRDAISSAPVVVFFYGGRWQEGDRADYGFVGRALAARGVLAYVADYRHFPQVRFPEFVADAAHAVRAARDAASADGGDPRRLFVVGHSAGAHLAAMLATDARHLAAVGMRPRDLRGAIGIAGPYDFLPSDDVDLQQIFGPPSRYADSQPINFVDGDEPPFLLLHGADDKLVWTRNSERLAAQLRAAGVAVEHRVYPDLGHVRILGALRYPSLAPTLDDVVAFLNAEPAASL